MRQLVNIVRLDIFRTLESESKGMVIGGAFVREQLANSR